MPGIGIISNANARLNKVSPKLKDKLNFILGRRGEVVSTGSLDDVDEAVSNFKKYDVDIIAISGGDGTAHRTLEKLLIHYDAKELPPILLLPSGTQNMVPKSFGITGTSISTMLLTQTKYTHNLPLTVVKRNLLKVNDHYSFMFGIGIAPRFLDAHYKRGSSMYHAVTLLGSYLIDAAKGGDVAKSLVAPIPLTMSMNGEESIRKEKFHSIFCSFTEELAMRFKPFPRSGWQKGRFESIMLDSSMKETSLSLPQLWLGTIKKLPGIRRELLESITFNLDSPEPYTLDGELYPPEKTFVISPGPELKFVIPRLRPLKRVQKVRSETIGPWGRCFYV
jgi:diacylglycerol kinase family enzyme